LLRETLDQSLFLQPNSKNSSVFLSFLENGTGEFKPNQTTKTAAEKEQ
jgi:hypothetical protein